MDDFSVVGDSFELCLSNLDRVLKRCKEAIGREGKLIIIEAVVGHMEWNKESIGTQLLCDMLLMATVDGRQRNETQWAKLFADAGFGSYRIHSVLGIRALIEVFSWKYD